MATRKRKSRKSRRSCKNGKLKRPVKTKSGRRRRCKKSRKRKYKMRPLKELVSNQIANSLRGNIDQRIATVMTLDIPELAQRDIINELERDKEFIVEFYNAVDENSKKVVLILKYIIQQEDLKKVQTVLKYYPKYLEKGGYMNGPDNYGYNPLLAACLYNQTDIAEFLIKKGANVNVKNTMNNTTPLINISGENNINLIQLLISRGANVNATSRDGTNPLLAACIQNNWLDNIEIVKLLISYTNNIDHRDNEGDTALILSVAEGAFGAAKELMEKGANVDIQSNNGKNALLWASKNGYDEIVIDLLRRGAKLNKKDNEDYTALMYATDNNHTEIVEMLLDAGADRTEYDEAILYRQKEERARDILEELHDNNWDVYNWFRESDIISRYLFDNNVDVNYLDTINVYELYQNQR